MDGEALYHRFVYDLLHASLASSSVEPRMWRLKQTMDREKATKRERGVGDRWLCKLRANLKSVLDFGLIKPSKESFWKCQRTGILILDPVHVV